MVCAVTLALILSAPGTSQAAVDQTAEQPLSRSLSNAAMGDTDDGSEPFARPTSDVVDGPLLGKWQGVRQSIDAELSVILLCRLSLAFCPSTAAIDFLTIVERARLRDGLARLGEINRTINLEIRPAADIDLNHVEDFWSSPLSTLSAAAGDCEDYAIAKFVLLRDAGVPAGDLRLVILRDARLQADHAVLAVRIDQRWRILDNRRLLMLDDAQFLRSQAGVNFQPFYSIGDAGIKRYDDTPLVATVPAPLPPVF